MTRRQADFSVDQWERVPGGGAIALLRLTGEWHGGPRPSPSDAELLLEGEDGIVHRSALPDPTAETAGLGWRVAFAVDAGIVESSATYRLSVPGREALDLPRPVERRDPGAQVAPVEEEETTERRRSIAEFVGLRSLRGGAGSPDKRQAAGDQAAPIEVQALEREHRVRQEPAEIRLAEAAAEAARATAQAEAAGENVRDLQARVSDLTRSLELERSTRNAAAESERRLSAELSRAEKELREALGTSERRGIKLAALDQELSRAKDEQDSRSRRRVEALTLDLARSKAELEASRVQLGEKDHAQARLEQELTSVRSEREELAGSLEELRLEHMATVQALEVSRREGEELTARQAELEPQLQETFTGSPRTGLIASLRQRGSRALVESDASAESLRETREELAGLLGELRLEHAATVESLVRSRREVEEPTDRRSELEAGLEAERPSAGVNAEETQGLEAVRMRSVEGRALLKELRAEAVRGKERAAMIEGRAVWLLDEVLTSA